MYCMYGDDQMRVRKHAFFHKPDLCLLLILHNHAVTMVMMLLW